MKDGAIVWWRIRTLAAVLTIPPLVHLTPTHRLARRLVRPGMGDAPPIPLERLVDWVDLLQRRLPWPWRSTCLKRATVLYALLRRGGVPVDLCIGVRRDANGALAAHAWLLRDDVPYLETQRYAVDTFRVIARFPESPAAC